MVLDRIAAPASLFVPLGFPCRDARLAQVRNTVPVLEIMNGIAAVRTRSLVPLAHLNPFSKERSAGTAPAPTCLMLWLESVKDRTFLIDFKTPNKNLGRG